MSSGKIGKVVGGATLSGFRRSYPIREDGLNNGSITTKEAPRCLTTTGPIFSGNGATEMCFEGPGSGLERVVVSSTTCSISGDGMQEGGGRIVLIEARDDAEEEADLTGDVASRVGGGKYSSRTDWGRSTYRFKFLGRFIQAGKGLDRLGRNGDSLSAS
jgi:hypothetical protein